MMNQIVCNKQIPVQWQEWLLTNLDRGCELNVLKSQMQSQGFALSSVESLLRSHQTTNNISSLEAPVSFDLNQVGKFTGKVISDPHIELIEVGSFITMEECHLLINLIRPSLSPSKTTTGEVGFRTSYTSYLDKTDAPLVAQIDKRMSEYLGLPQELSEPIQAQLYREGNLFKPHTDYFEVSQEIDSFDDWQRTWTFMLVLQAAGQGGATNFTELPASFKPAAGGGLLWNNLDHNGKPNPWTLHEGEAVRVGEKIIITKWFTDRKTH